VLIFKFKVDVRDLPVLVMDHKAASSSSTNSTQGTVGTSAADAAASIFNDLQTKGLIAANQA
jgi:hypothetical protein